MVMLHDNDSTPSIQLHDVSKTYKVGKERLHVLQSIDLTVPSGTLLAIMGPSGAGKTTLSHVIGGLIKPDSGSVIVDGKDLQTMRDATRSRYRNRHIGFVFQNFSLLPHYTALENVAVPLMVAGLSHRQQVKRANTYLTAVGLEQQVHQRADELSGGQRQRVAIARALATNPRVLIADEPTGSLDSARGHEIMDILASLARTKGITVLMVTHDQHLADRADQIVYLQDGKVVKHANR